MHPKDLVEALLEGEETHRELGAFKGNLFSVDVTKTDLFQNVGRWIRVVRTPEQVKQFGLLSLLPYKIMHLQKDYAGRIVYRIENQLDRFGRPMGPENVEFISEEEAAELWNSLPNLNSGEEFDPNFDS